MRWFSCQLPSLAKNGEKMPFKMGWKGERVFFFFFFFLSVVCPFWKSFGLLKNSFQKRTKFNDIFHHLA